VGHQAQDDGFHEIQLNGKQLVFLFMAATVVSVVIFLCGVLVGRGVPYGRNAVADASASVPLTDTIPQQPAAAPAPPPAGSDPTAAAPPTPADDLSYFNRLEKPTPSAEHLKAEKDRSSAAQPRASKEPATPPPAPPKEPAHVAPPPAAAPAAAPSSAPPSTPAAVPAVPAAASEPSGQGFAVQIAALNVRSEADAIARRLSSKGYAAYVLSPVSGTPAVYRVRVGKFPTRREAESVAAKLQKEEQFKPWVTR
jgi:cell division septation protein DedD